VTVLNANELFTLKWLVYKTDEQRRGKKRGKPGNRPLTMENKLRVTGGEVGRGDGLNR